MANLIKWSATLGTYTTLIAGASTAPTLKNLANGATKIGNTITGNRNQYCALELKVRGASAFVAGGYVGFWWINSADDTNYEDGSDSVQSQRPQDAIFPVGALSTQQVITLWNVLLPPFNFKPLIINSTGQAFTNTDNENILSYRPYNDEIQ